MTEHNKNQILAVVKLPTILPDGFLRCLSSADRKRVAAGQITRDEAISKGKVVLEKELARLVVGYLKLQEIEVGRANSAKKSTYTVGWPDLTFCYHGRAVAWELKLPGEKPRPEQVLCHCRMIKNGWTVDVVTSLDMARDLLKHYSL